MKPNVHRNCLDSHAGEWGGEGWGWGGLFSCQYFVLCACVLVFYKSFYTYIDNFRVSILCIYLVI